MSSHSLPEPVLARKYEAWCALHATRASSAFGYVAASAATVVLLGMAVQLGILKQPRRRAFSLTLSSLMYEGPASLWKYLIITLTLVSSICATVMISLLDRGNWVTPLLGGLVTLGMMATLGLLMLRREDMDRIEDSWGFGPVGVGHLALVAFVTLLWPTVLFIAISRRSFMRGWRAPIILNLIFLVAIPGIVAASSWLSWMLYTRPRWGEATEDIGVRSSLRSSAEMLYIAFLISTLLFIAGMPRCV